jgi:tripartite-type tricarboxylate transporter receptor subunit TctC
MRRDQTRSTLLALALGGLALGTFTSAAAGQSYPSQNIRILVPGGAGTPPDIVTRVVANAVTEADGWQFVVENKPGAIQTLAGSEVLRNPADGYTIFAQAMPIASAPTMLANMPFSLVTDFAPVIRLSASYNVLVVNPSVPANSIAELVALIKSQPDKLTFSSGGAGTPAHLIGESLPVVDLIASGKLRAIAVTAPKRIDALKDVPSVVEQGFPGLVVEEWIGFSVKSGTPEEIITRLNAAINKVLKTPKVIEALAKIGAVPVGGTPESYGALVKQQVEYWGKIVKEAGIRPQ